MRVHYTGSVDESIATVKAVSRQHPWSTDQVTIGKQQHTTSLHFYQLRKPLAKIISNFVFNQYRLTHANLTSFNIPYTISPNFGRLSLMSKLK